MKHLHPSCATLSSVSIFAIVLLWFSGLLGAPPTALLVIPERDGAWSATREIICLAAAPDGSLWAGTTGGVLRREPSGVWRKWTRADGLSAHEARAISFEDGAIRVRFPTSTALWRDSKWQIENTSLKPDSTPQSTSVAWRGARWTATTSELREEKTGDDGKTKVTTFALPPSSGTHISALWPRGATLWAALFGDGLWSFDGTKWQRVPIEIPLSAREMTALCEDNNTLWIGTRRSGVWSFAGGQWTPHLKADEPWNHNIQNMTMFEGELWGSTLEDGLWARTSGGWKYFESELSSNAPRQLIVFREALWVRHGGGQVDKWDGTRWSKNVFPFLPRGKVFSIATDGRKLYLGQWGGWSEWDGQSWEHFMNLPELQGIPVMTLLPDGDGQTLWLGTQNRGIIEATRTIEIARDGPPKIADTQFSAAQLQKVADGESPLPEITPSDELNGAIPLSPSLPQIGYDLKFHDERHGLSDDWITALSRSSKVLYAGTFVGGLCRQNGAHWLASKELAGENVTALEPDGDGGIFITTRTGLWHRNDKGKMANLGAQVPWLDTELQALSATDGGLWIGSRTGLFWLRQSTLERAINPLTSAEK